MTDTGISWRAAGCVWLNMLMGSGFLALPAVFASAGVWTSACVLLLVSCVMCVSCMLEANAVLRVQALLASCSYGGSAPFSSLRSVPEVTEACDVLLGPAAKYTYLFLLVCTLYGTGWVYAILFGTTTLQLHPHCTDTDAFDADTQCRQIYMLHIGCFALLTTAMSVYEVREQAAFQRVMAWLRGAMVLLMSVSSLVAVCTHTQAEAFPNTLEDDALPRTTWGSVNVATLFQLVSTCVFTQFLSSGVSIVADAMERREHAHWALCAAFAGTFALYVCVGTFVSLCFGTETNDQANLNWRGFRLPPYSASHSSTAINTIQTALSYFALLFPAVDVLSVYPLNALVMANNVLACFPASTATRSSYTSISNDERSLAEDVLRARRVRMFMRMAAALLPCICAAAVPDFLRIVAYTGALAAPVCFIFPPLLSYASLSSCEESGKSFALPHATEDLGEALNAREFTGVVPPQPSESGTSNGSTRRTEHADNFALHCTEDDCNIPLWFPPRTPWIESVSSHACLCVLGGCFLLGTIVADAYGTP